MRKPREASSTDASRATVRVIRTDEELMIARSVCCLCEQQQCAYKMATSRTLFGDCTTMTWISPNKTPCGL